MASRTDIDELLERYLSTSHASLKKLLTWSGVLTIVGTALFVVSIHSIALLVLAMVLAATGSIGLFVGGFMLVTRGAATRQTQHARQVIRSGHYGRIEVEQRELRINGSYMGTSHYVKVAPPSGRLVEIWVPQEGEVAWAVGVLKEHQVRFSAN
jgi:hypothetical protein